MEDTNWQGKVASGEQDRTPQVVELLGNIINERGSLLRGKLRPNPTEILFLGCAHYETFEAIGQMLGGVFGTATQNINKSPKGEVFGHNMTFPGGASITYLASRSNGMSVTIPRSCCAQLQTALDGTAISQCGMTYNH